MRIGAPVEGVLARVGPLARPTTVEVRRGQSGTRALERLRTLLEPSFASVEAEP